jgi:CheY-like chemotaxis protein
MARILIVDDDPDQLELRQLLLENAGHEVKPALTADETLSLFNEWNPAAVVMDLRLPSLAEGLRLIRGIRSSASPTQIVVTSGWPADLNGREESKMIDHLIPKPVATAKLLKLLSTLGMMLAIVCSSLRAAETAPFTVSEKAEMIAEVELVSPGADWARTGREAALAGLQLDGAKTIHIMTYAGDQPHKYNVLLGELSAGNHSFSITRNELYSAPGAGLTVRGVTFHKAADQDVAANTPFLYARANTIGKFTDIPLILYCERLVENGVPVLQYTVIFSNEDGGTSTRGLMARWGRTTDVEYVYRAFPDHATIQARGHKEVVYDGPRDGRHPLLMPVTDNNMVAGEGPSPICYQIPAVIADLTKASREQVMDDYPITWQVMAKELIREGKLRPFGVVDGEKIGDPRNYLYIEANVNVRGGRIAAMARLKGDMRWRMANLGRFDLAIERSGWIRTTVELPPGTRPEQIAEMGFQCLAEKAPGTCRVDSVRQAFLLGQDYLPRPSLFSTPAGRTEFASGEAATWTLKSK